MELDKIKQLVYRHFGVDPDLVSKRVSGVETNAMKAFCMIARDEGYAFTKIGLYANRDHSSIIQAYKGAEQLCDAYKDFKASIDQLKLTIWKDMMLGVLKEKHAGLIRDMQHIISKISDIESDMKKLNQEL